MLVIGELQMRIHARRLLADVAFAADCERAAGFERPQHRRVHHRPLGLRVAVPRHVVARQTAKPALVQRPVRHPQARSRRRPAHGMRLGRSPLAVVTREAKRIGLLRRHGGGLAGMAGAARVGTPVRARGSRIRGSRVRAAGVALGAGALPGVHRAELPRTPPCEHSHAGQPGAFGDEHSIVRVEVADRACGILRTAAGGGCRPDCDAAGEFQGEPPGVGPAEGEQRRAVRMKSVNALRGSVGNEDDAVGADRDVLGPAGLSGPVAGAADVVQPAAVGREHLHAAVEHVDHAHVALRRQGHAERDAELQRTAAALADVADVPAALGVKAFDAMRGGVGHPDFCADLHGGCGFEGGRGEEIERLRDREIEIPYRSISGTLNRSHCVSSELTAAGVEAPDTAVRRVAHETIAVARYRDRDRQAEAFGEAGPAQAPVHL